MENDITLDEIVADYELHEEAYAAIEEWPYEAVDFEGILDLLENWSIED